MMIYQSTWGNIMTIDSLYSEIDKNYFYVGRISQVYRDNSTAQVENLTLLSHRKLVAETVTPSTINYMVIIDSIQGLFWGRFIRIRCYRVITYTKL